MTCSLLQWIIRIVVAAFFIIAAVGKITGPAAFAASIANYQLIAFPYTYLAALWLPWVEVTAAFALLWRRTLSEAALILIGLLLAFECALASAWIRGLDIHCGCLGAFDNTGVQGAFFRNLVLLVLLATTLWQNSRR